MGKIEDWQKVINQLASITLLPEESLTEDNFEYLSLIHSIKEFEAQYGRSLETLLCLIDVALNKKSAAELLEQAWLIAKTEEERQEVIESYEDFLKMS